MPRHRDMATEAVMLIRAIGIGLGWLLVALIALAGAVGQIVMDVLIACLAVVIGVPWWAFLWLRWWRRSCASS